MHPEENQTLLSAFKKITLCSGIGKTAPSTSRTLPDGCVVPLGPGVVQEDTEDSSLLYNEYIVYNVDQVNVKYLFQLKFVYEKRRR